MELVEAYCISDGGKMTTRRVETWSSNVCLSCPRDIWIRRADLMGKELTVAMVQKEPYVIDMEREIGYAFDLWKFFQDNMNLTTKYVRLQSYHRRRQWECVWFQV